MLPTRILAALIGLPLSCPVALAQLARTDLVPLTHGLALSADLPKLEFRASASESWLEQHAQSMPLQYGELLPAELDLMQAAQPVLWQGGWRVLQVEIQSPGAKSLGLEFGAFDLPDGAALFLHDGRGGLVFGAYGDHDETLSGGLAIQPYPGERLVLELNLPPEAEARPVLVLSQVVHDHRGVYGLPVSGGPVLAGSCLIDVNCSEGDPWRKQQRAVVRTLSGGALCSGALLNNTTEDLTPYVLTASHCGQGSNTVFLFNYETPQCGAGSAPQNQSLSGCTVLGDDPTNDGRFLRISTPVPASYQPYYAGWSRETTNTWYAVSIGHPAGGPKKISVDANGTNKQPTRWQVGWTAGMLLGGSSGGPLFDSFGRARGAACCVNGFDCTQVAWYGRFDQFWTSNNLAQWLNPLGVPAATLDGFDPADPQNLLGNGGVGSDPSQGSGGPPVIQSLSPTTLPAVTVDAPAVLSLFGSGFVGTFEVRLDGVPLLDFPPQFTVVSDTQLNVLIFPQTKLGPVELTVVNGQGSDSQTFEVVLNPSPVLDMALSDPSLLIQFFGLDLWAAAQPGDLAFFLGSTSNAPTSLPGLVELGIGNQLNSLFLLGAQPVSAQTGYAFFHQPLPGSMPTGLKLYLQAAIFEAQSGQFPLVATNVQSGTILL